jgi:uncharacterized protein GlcG (DUF336 family)
MAVTAPALRLTHEGALMLLHAAVEHAASMKQPQDIAIVDQGLNLLAFIRMDGARVPSAKSALRKAMTAAATGRPTGGMSPETEIKLAIATEGDMVNLPGGLPVIIDGHVVGGIGVGSGTGEQDREVANAALQKLSGAKTF